ncbi:NAD-dependent epimerase/dehydratase [Bacillus methanolicus PB1]|uniref:NAD-dependent epimerase/dehydratase n=1 Tax=Bacillus methanolicus PB1 TaxID=997296 RepID=I3DY72_BACMT|nr:NAD-dependent epimerase/dehydratase family protein [Bacillus methanolicus]EIJ79193.1 NAD-dependent epimerase/dehydratase [Bacillus methanolicus PB1]
MKVLITGGAGFIGSHLAQHLLKKRYEIFIIDCLHSYYSPKRKKQHLKKIQELGSFQFFDVNLLDREKTMALFRQISPEAVIHLAALPGVAYSISNPLEYVDYDIKATINVLKASGESKANQVIFASSSSVYGNQQKIPFREDMASGKVISPYAASKHAAESFCHVYEDLYGFKVKILRFFTVYGPWQRPDMAIASFIKKLLRHEEITVFGKGSIRDYTYIDDIVNGICLAMTKLDQSEILNLGSGNAISMEMLLSDLKQFFPNMKVNLEAERKGDVYATWADISKANQLLGYQPQVDFKTGLLKTVEWAKKNENLL